MRKCFVPLSRPIMSTDRGSYTIYDRRSLRRVRHVFDPDLGEVFGDWRSDFVHDERPLPGREWPEWQQRQRCRWFVFVS